MKYIHEKIDGRPREFVPSPTLMAGIFQPNHSVTTRRAKISPNPSITPLIKGRTRLMAREDANTSTRVRVDKEESKIESVAEMGGGAGGVSGKMDGKEESMEGTFSHLCISSGIPPLVEGSALERWKK
jgi:hypothetical protein